MLRQRQFSLRWMFLELLWIAAAVGLLRGISHPEPLWGLVYLFAVLACLGAAVGAVFGSRSDGVAWALLAGVMVSQMLPDL